MDGLKEKIQLCLIGLDIYGSNSAQIELTKEELTAILELIDNE